ncbi:MAG TPA: pentapeptide repeat-containing protein [Verrucomicrobiae bacterium]|nr:pentapeptide repeat-containing protein [Verrucomicrobiae bacterium]
MLVRELRQRPDSWREYRQSVAPKWTVPLHALEWVFNWVAYWLSRWAFLEVLEYLGALSVLFGVLFYVSEAGERRQQRHYQAWQVINTAQGKGGSGGRIEALQELNADRVPLIGVDVSGAFLQGLKLARASLARADFHVIDARDSVLEDCDLTYADLHMANFRHGRLDRSNLEEANLEGAYLIGASLVGARLKGADLKGANLTHCDLNGLVWEGIQSVESANIYHVRNAPVGFVTWARTHGAVATAGDDE